MMTDAPTPFDVSVAELKARLDAKEDLFLLDCRNPDEWETARIEGAQLLPMGELVQRADELTPHKARPIVVHCHHGGRSARVANWLRANGYPQAQNLAGGIDAWSLEIDSSVPRY
jgi:rhodanese-related sulfurtransferase